MPQIIYYRNKDLVFCLMKGCLRKEVVARESGLESDFSMLDANIGYI